MEMAQEARGRSQTAMENVPTPASSAAVRRKRVLVADVALAQSLARALSAEGYEVETVSQSLRVLDRAREWRPDMVLLDADVPYLSGLDQVRLFSLVEDVAHVPLIMMGAAAAAGPSGRDSTPGERWMARIVDWVSKPFDPADVLVALARL